MQTKPIVSLFSPDDDPALDHQLHKADDTELEKIVRDRLETIYHPVSTARMGAREDGGVVDAELKVHGVKGLRVCDASIFPSMVSGHTVRLFSCPTKRLMKLTRSCCCPPCHSVRRVHSHGRKGCRFDQGCLVCVGCYIPDCTRCWYTTELSRTPFC